MTSRATVAKLSALIKAKREEEGIGLREARQKSGVSASTLSRLERGISSSLPDLNTLSRLATWLDVPLASVLDEKEKGNKKKERPLDTREQIEVYLRADKNLSKETADALYRSFRILYDQFSNQEKKKKDL